MLLNPFPRSFHAPDEGGGYGSITHEQLEMMKSGVDPFSEPTEQPEPPAVEVTEETVGEEAPPPIGTEPPAAAEPGRKGDPSKPLHALRSRVAQYEGILGDPAQLAAYVERMGFDLTPRQERQMEQQVTAGADPLALFDPETQAALRPLIDRLAAAEQGLSAAQQKLGEYDGMLASAEQRAELADLDNEYPGAAAVVAEFDQLRPDLAGHYGPFDKYAISLGSRAIDPTQQAGLAAELLTAMDPEARAELLAPYATAAATEQIAGMIKPGAQKERPVTLSGAPPARGNDQLPDMARISASDYANLPPDVRRKMLAGG